MSLYYFNPGELRKKVTFQKMVDTENEIHENVQVPQDYATVWASLEPLKGREYFEAQKIRPELTYRLKIRYYPGITPDMLIKFGDRLFQIIGILDLNERNTITEIMCIEKVKV